MSNFPTVPTVKFPSFDFCIPVHECTDEMLVLCTMKAIDIYLMEKKTFEKNQTNKQNKPLTINGKSIAEFFFDHHLLLIDRTYKDLYYLLANGVYRIECMEEGLIVCVKKNNLMQNNGSNETNGSSKIIRRRDLSTDLHFMREEAEEIAKQKELTKEEEKSKLNKLKPKDDSEDESEDEPSKFKYFSILLVYLARYIEVCPSDSMSQLSILQCNDIGFTPLGILALPHNGLVADFLFHTYENYECEIFHNEPTEVACLLQSMGKIIRASGTQWRTEMRFSKGMVERIHTTKKDNLVNIPFDGTYMQFTEWMMNQLVLTPPSYHPHFSEYCNKYDCFCLGSIRELKNVDSLDQWMAGFIRSHSFVTSALPLLLFDISPIPKNDLLLNLAKDLNVLKQIIPLMTLDSMMTAFDSCEFEEMIDELSTLDSDFSLDKNTFCMHEYLLLQGLGPNLGGSFIRPLENSSISRIVQFCERYKYSCIIERKNPWTSLPSWYSKRLYEKYESLNSRIHEIQRMYICQRNGRKNSPLFTSNELISDFGWSPIHYLERWGDDDRRHNDNEEILRILEKNGFPSVQLFDLVLSLNMEDLEHQQIRSFWKSVKYPWPSRDKDVRKKDISEEELTFDPLQPCSRNSGDKDYIPSILYAAICMKASVQWSEKQTNELLIAIIRKFKNDSWGSSDSKQRELLQYILHHMRAYRIPINKQYGLFHEGMLVHVKDNSGNIIASGDKYLNIIRYKVSDDKESSDFDNDEESSVDSKSEFELVWYGNCRTEILLYEAAFEGRKIVPVLYDYDNRQDLTLYIICTDNSKLCICANCEDYKNNPCAKAYLNNPDATLTKVLEETPNLLLHIQRTLSGMLSKNIMDYREYIKCAEEIGVTLFLTPPKYEDKNESDEDDLYNIAKGRESSECLILYCCLLEENVLPLQFILAYSARNGICVNFSERSKNGDSMIEMAYGRKEHMKLIVAFIYNYKSNLAIYEEEQYYEMLKQLGDYDRVEKWLNKKGENDSEYVHSRCSLAKLYQMKGEYSSAIKILDEIIKKQPTYANAYSTKSSCLFEESISKNKTAHQPSDSNIHISIEEESISLPSSIVSQCISLLDVAMSHSPENPIFDLQKTQIYFTVGDKRSAEKVIQSIDMKLTSKYIKRIFTPTQQVLLESIVKAGTIPTTRSITNIHGDAPNNSNETSSSSSSKSDDTIIPTVHIQHVQQTIMNRAIDAFTCGSKMSSIQINDIHTQMKDIQQAISEMRQMLSDAKVDEQAKVNASVNFIRAESPRLYTYYLTFYWCTINYLDANRQLSTGMVQGTGSVVGSLTTDRLGLAEKVIGFVKSASSSIPIVGLISNVLSTIYSSMVNMMREDHIRAVTESLMKNCESILAVQLLVGRIAIQLVNMKRQKLLLNTKEENSFPSSLSFMEKISFASKWFSKQLSLQIQSLKDCDGIHASEIIAEAQQDSALLLAFLIHRYETKVRKISRENAKQQQIQDQSIQGGLEEAIQQHFYETFLQEIDGVMSGKESFINHIIFSNTTTTISTNDLYTKQSVSTNALPSSTSHHDNNWTTTSTVYSPPVTIPPPITSVGNTYVYTSNSPVGQTYRTTQENSTCCVLM